MHYVDEGAATRSCCCTAIRPGASSTAALFRPLVEAGHRVIVPDMIGFGLSEKPAREQAHSLDGHIANLAGLGSST